MHTLTKGLNEITLVVTAEDESTKEYTVKITRIGSRNNYLKSLEVEGHLVNPEFDKEIPGATLVLKDEKGNDLKYIPEGGTDETLWAYAIYELEK